MVENLIMKFNSESFVINMEFLTTFLAPSTPQSNGVVERKNRTLQEMSRTMLNEQFIPQRFWCHALETGTYILNRVLIMKAINKTPYEILRGELDERTLRLHAQDRSNFIAFVSTIKPRNIKEAIKDESWTMAMQEELDLFIRNDVWDLVPYLMLKKCGLENSKTTKTPISRKRVLTLDKDSESNDSSKYKGMIGSLIYLTASRPGIMFSVCLCARFQEDPKVSHLEAVKRIFRYVKGTQHLGLGYHKDTGVNVLVYVNSDHAGDVVDRKSTSGICTFMGSCLTSWFSKKQTSLANFITEPDYVAAGRACQ
ncbi:retrovirus-related pol polyprotein from transposon TNT 1-94 [Tanacetum coccineum]